MELEEKVKRCLEPYIREVADLNRRIDNLKEENKKLNKIIYDIQIENSKLKENHTDSGLKRDVPMARLWSTQSGFTNYCPACYKMVSNWEPYCCICGQRLDNGNPLAENEVIMYDGKLIPATQQKTERQNDEYK